MVTTTCESQSQRSSEGSARGCVLLIEDDDNLLRVLARVLQFEGHTVLTAADAATALARAHDHGRSIEAIITDMLLPDSGATQLALKLLLECPGVPMLFMSGAPGEAATLPPLGVRTQFLSKPFSPSDLRSALRVLLM